MSNINPQSIDGTYPIAGQDNNSQGFRDNFTNIINNFTFAAAELTDLQTYAILRAPLGSIGQTGSPTNNMNYTLLTAPQLKRAVETVNVIGNLSVGGSSTIDWSTAHFQTVGVTSTATFAFAGTWPASGLHAKLRLRIESFGTTLVTLPSAVTQNISNIQGWTANTNITLGEGVHLFEFSTYDNGTTVAINDVLRNYNTVQSLSVTGNLTSNGAHVETGYRQLKPTGNIAVTANVGTNRLMMHPTGTIISFGANVTLPNTQVNGTIFNISSNVTIASLDVRPAWNGVVAVSPFGNVTNVTAGTNTRYMYISADSTWYKIA